MKIVVLLSLSLFSFASFSQSSDSSQPSLKSVLNFSTCKLQITKESVIFGKEKSYGRSKRLVFFAHEVSSHLRRLKDGRSVKIQGMDKKYLQLDDSSLSSICVLAGRKCARDIADLSIAQIQELSGNNVKISCRKDSIKDF